MRAMNPRQNIFVVKARLEVARRIAVGAESAYGGDADRRNLSIWRKVAQPYYANHVSSKFVQHRGAKNVRFVQTDERTELVPRPVELRADSAVERIGPGAIKSSIKRVLPGTQLVVDAAVKLLPVPVSR